MPALTLGEAELIGIIVHTLMYGIYVVLFIGSIYLPSRRTGSPPNKGLLAVTIILFALITSHWIVQIVRLFEAYIKHLGGPGDVGVSKYYAFGPNPKNMAKTALYVLQSFVGDATMVYRVYIVWGRNRYVAAIPATMSLVLLGSGAAVVYNFHQLTPGEDIFKAAVGRWILVVFCMSIATNLSVTALIAYKILKINKHSKGAGGRSLTAVVQIIFESAGLYTAFLIITMGGYIAHNPYQFVTLDCTSPAIGIAFTLIIVRVGLGIGSDGYTNQHGTSGDRPRMTGINTDRQIPLNNLSVNVNREVTTHHDSMFEDSDQNYISEQKADEFRKEQGL